MHQRENPSTVNQLVSQIQELQDTVNSLSEEKKFCDPETASSSGMSHVPSQTSRIPSPRGMISRDSGDDARLNATLILQSRLIAGGCESREGRQTVFFTPLDPFRDSPDEEKPTDDLSIPRKVHHHSEWKTTQDAVYWVNLARAQDKELRFWHDKI